MTAILNSLNCVLVSIIIATKINVNLAAYGDIEQVHSPPSPSFSSISGNRNKKLYISSIVHFLFRIQFVE